MTNVLVRAGADWADACLLRGLLRERAGDPEGALKAWREGLVRNWPGYCFTYFAITSSRARDISFS